MNYSLMIFRVLKVFRIFNPLPLDTSEISLAIVHTYKQNITHFKKPCQKTLKIVIAFNT